MTMLKIHFHNPFSRKSRSTMDINSSSSKQEQCCSSISSLSSSSVQKPSRIRNVSGNTLETEPSERSLISCEPTEVHHLDESELFMVKAVPEVQHDGHVEVMEVARPTVIHLLHPHKRRPALIESDYDELYMRSRAWMYDPNDSLAMERPRHHDRQRQRSLCAYDFEQFIFKPTAPRLG